MPRISTVTLPISLLATTTMSDASNPSAMFSKICGEHGRSGRMLCYDRFDMPDPHGSIPVHAPTNFIPTCDNVDYLGMDPTQFGGSSAAICVNHAMSSILQHMDDARTGYVDPRAYKKTSRLLAPLSMAGSPKRPSVIAGVASNAAPHIELDVNAVAGAARGPVPVPKGRIVGRR
jgi:hypothetical protein